MPLTIAKWRCITKRARKKSREFFFERSDRDKVLVCRPCDWAVPSGAVEQVVFRVPEQGHECPLHVTDADTRSEFLRDVGHNAIDLEALGRLEVNFERPVQAIRRKEFSLRSLFVARSCFRTRFALPCPDSREFDDFVGCHRVIACGRRTRVAS